VAGRLTLTMKLIAVVVDSATDPTLAKRTMPQRARRSSTIAVG